MNLDIVKVDNGIYNVCVIKDDEYIGRSIIHGQEWDRWMRREVRTHHKPGTDILDIGANIGYNTLIFSDYSSCIYLPFFYIPPHFFKLFCTIIIFYLFQHNFEMIDIYD